MSGQRFAPPADLAMFPLAKLDPRLFRIPFPEEPKPQHSYIGLIAMGILSSTEKKLVLADIYQYVLDNFPYFRHRGPGWRNSIRHNLSLNDCFIKSGRASNGKGHFWAVHPACADDFQKGDFSRRKAQRKVRRYLGMNVGMDEEDTPPSSPVMADHADTIKFEPSEVVKDEPVNFKFDSLMMSSSLLRQPLSIRPPPVSPPHSTSPIQPGSPSPPLGHLQTFPPPCFVAQSSSPSPPSGITTAATATAGTKRSISFGIDSLLQKEEKKPRVINFLQPEFLQQN